MQPRRSTASLAVRPPCGLFHLREARRVDVQRLDREEHLPPKEAREVVVDAPGRLRQSPPGLERPVGPVGVAAGPIGPAASLGERRHGDVIVHA